MPEVKRTFNPAKHKLMRAYKDLFLGDDGKLNVNASVILNDLQKFCRAQVTDSSFNPEPLWMALYEGRREVFNHMTKHLKSNRQDCYDIVADYD